MVPGYPDDLVRNRRGAQSLLQWLPGVAGAETSVDQIGS